MYQHTQTGTVTYGLARNLTAVFLYPEINMLRNGGMALQFGGLSPSTVSAYRLSIHDC
jgi:hypothetical protein